MRKIILSVLGILLIVAAIFGAKAIIDSNKINRPPLQKSVKAVYVDTVLNRTVPVIIPASGTVTALRRTDLFSEVEGVFRSSSKEFRPAQRYERGQVLLNIDASEFAANVRAARSEFYNQIVAVMPDLRLDFPEIYPKWEAYLRKVNVDQTLPSLPEMDSEQERYFISGRGIMASYYNIKNLETRLQKFTIVAPFTGVLTEALVTQGSLIRPGQKLGEFIDPTVFELEVAVRKSFSEFLREGEQVELSTLEGNQTFSGKISRINTRVDQGTQTIRVYIRTDDPNVKEGMFLQAELEARSVENAIEIPRQLLVDQSKVYVVEDNVLNLVEVEPVYFGAETVVVKGLQDGTQLLADPVPGAYTGMLVEVTQAPTPSNTQEL